jgi:spartin
MIQRLLNANRVLDPVVITLPEDGSLKIGVAPASATSIERAIHPAYRNSTLVNKAAMASRLIITSSDYVSKTLQTQADNFTQTTKPNAKPMTFTPTTHGRIRKVHDVSSSAVGVSSKVIGHVSKYAETIGASLSKRSAGKTTTGPDGKPVPYEPGLLNKSLMAFSTLVDGVDQAGRGLLASSTAAATTVVAHRYGDEAGEVSRHIGGNVKNVALVYIDATGVSRKAIVKSVLKGMVVGRVSDGSKLVVPGTEDAAGASSPPPVVARAGSVPSALDKQRNWKEKEAAEGRFTEDGVVMSGGSGKRGGEKALPLPPPPYSAGGKAVDEHGFPQDSKDQWRY